MFVSVLVGQWVNVCVWMVYGHGDGVGCEGGCARFYVSAPHFGSQDTGFMLLLIERWMRGTRGGLRPGRKGVS